MPGLVRWPGRVGKGVVSDQVCITMDFSASIVRIAGARPPAERPFDGIDVIRLLEEGREARKRTLFWRGKRGPRTRWAVRDGDLKYVRQRDDTRTTEYLFDLAHDVGERHNLLADRPEEVTRLKRLLTDWEHEVRAVR